MLIFCEKCCRLLGPSTPVFKEVYKSHAICLTCRTENGETFALQSKERKLLELEKQTRVISNAEDRRKWSPYIAVLHKTSKSAAISRSSPK